MENIKIDNWHDFIDIINNLEVDNKKNQSRWCFRGQSDDSHKIESSLYRKYGNVSYRKYCDLIKIILPELNTIFDKQFVFHPKDINSDLFFINVFHDDKKNDKLGSIKTLIHLRHHGFPSPLLDWSESPYIALYFAVNDLNCQTDASLYCLQEIRENGKSFSQNHHFIQNIGPCISGTKRHYLQQTVYTYAISINEEEVLLSSHENAFRDSSDCDQDYCKKITIPGSLKKYILVELQKMGITAYSLYASEDAAIKYLYEKHHFKIEDAK